MLVVYCHMDNLAGSQFGQTVSKIHDNLVNFILKSHLPFVQITSILAKKGHESLKLLSKMAMKNRTQISIWNILTEKTRPTTFSEVPLLLEIFLWNNPKSHVPRTFQLDYLETFCKW